MLRNKVLMIFVTIAIEYQTPNEEKESVLMLLLSEEKDLYCLQIFIC